MNKKIINLFLIFLFVFKFTSNLNAASPIISENEQTIELNNGLLKMVFQKGEIFNLLSISTVTNEKSWVSSLGMRNSVWTMVLIDENGTTYNIDPINGKFNGIVVDSQTDENIRSLSCSWDLNIYGDNSINVKVRIYMTSNSGYSDWEIESSMPSNFKVLSFTFPRITFLRTNNSKAILASGFGAEYNIPANANFNLNHYPSSRSTIQAMCMHEGGESVYFATHDDHANMKSFNVLANSSNGVTLFTESEASMAWTDDGVFRLPWKVSLGIHPNGWEASMKDWYKPFTYNTLWGAKKLQDRGIAEWLYNNDMWIHSGNASATSLSVTKRALDYFGAHRSAVHPYYWMNFEFDTNYPEFFPAKEGFDNFIDEVHNLGSYLMPYINARLWDTLAVSYTQLNGKEKIALQRNGKPYMEISPSKAPNVPVCPSVPLWNDIMLDLTQRILGEEEGHLNCDAIYYDQVASARSRACWNPNHNHALGGGDFWHYSYRNIFNNIREVLGPDHIISTEQNAECYMDLFDIFYMSNSAPYDQTLYPHRYVPLFPLIYSDRALLYAFNIRNFRNISLIYKNTLTLLWGSQLGGIQADLIMNNVPVPYREFLRTLVDFREQQKDLFRGRGEFLKEIIPGGDNPIIDIPEGYESSNVVRGAIWKNSEDKEVALFVNFDSKSHSIVLPDGTLKTMPQFSCYRFDFGNNTAVDSYESNNIKVYTNESKIVIEGLDAFDKYRIYNTLGQLMDMGSSKGNETIKSHCGNGVMLIQVSQANNPSKTLNYKVLVK